MTTGKGRGETAVARGQLRRNRACRIRHADWRGNDTPRTRLGDKDAMPTHPALCFPPRERRRNTEGLSTPRTRERDWRAFRCRHNSARRSCVAAPSKRVVGRQLPRVTSGGRESQRAPWRILGFRDLVAMLFGFSERLRTPTGCPILDSRVRGVYCAAQPLPCHP
jgi:hypothetical protein